MKSKKAKLKGVPQEMLIKEFGKAIKFGYYILLSHKPKQVLDQFEDWFQCNPKNSLLDFNVKEELIKKFNGENEDFNEQPRNSKPQIIKSQAYYYGRLR